MTFNNVQQDIYWVLKKCYIVDFLLVFRDLRARLEMAISRVVELGEKLGLDKEKRGSRSCSSSDDFDDVCKIYFFIMCF